MFSKTKAKPLALGLALVLALAAAPQALAGPAPVGPTLGGDVAQFLADLWRSVVSFVGADDGELGPMQVPNGKPVDESLGAGLIPNGQASGETGPLIIPDGDRNSLEDPESELGPMLIPNG